VIDVGDACAYSTNGHAWRIRQQTSSGRFRWGATLVSDENVNEVRIVNADNLLDALRRRPPVPFPIRDRFELWLLNKNTRKPLALLKTCYSTTDISKVTDPHWQPFLMNDTNFVSGTLEQSEADKKQLGWKIPHRDRLDRLINVASRPYPIAQWIERQSDGSGIGKEGLRVEDNEIGRHYAAEEFPELLISEDWDDETELGLVNDYHAWQAAWLLAHQNLKTETRERLEKAACNRPQSLLASYSLIPEIINEEAIEVALVSAKLMNAS
jgi:hypothetical protein